MRIQEVFCLIKFLHYLVDRVEVKEMLRLIIDHLEVLRLKDHDFIIKFALIQPFKEFEYVLALTSHDISLSKHIYNFKFIDPSLLCGHLINLNKDICNLNLD